MHIRPFKADIGGRTEASSGRNEGLKADIFVVKHLSDKTYQLVFNNKTLTASSLNLLKEGTAYTGRLFFNKNAVVFEAESKLQQEARLPQVLPLNNAQTAALKLALASGLKLDNAKLALLSSLLNTYNAELKQKEKDADRKVLSLLPFLAAKNISIKDRLIEKVQELTGFKQNSSGLGDENNEKQQQETFTGDFKDALFASSEEAGLLSVFNHITAEYENWIIIPFRLQGKKTLDGIIRIKTVKPDNKAVQFNICFEKAQTQWAFIFTERPDGMHMSIYCSDPAAEKRNEKIVKEILEIIGNKGIKFDDSIKDGFNGFCFEMQTAVDLEV
jgi:hypothetical protein